MRVAFITVGDPLRQTGGYLYHSEVFARIGARGVNIVHMIAAGASREAQERATAQFGRQFNPRGFDVIVIDALARVVCAPWIELWRQQRPIVAMVHELPSIANNDSATDQADEQALLAADMIITVSSHGSDILQGRGVEPERIIIAQPGLNRLRVNRRRTPATNQPLLALCVAQWIPRKGICTLVTAWKEAQRRDAKLVLVGETNADVEYSAEVWNAIANLPSVSIQAHGPVSDAQLAELYGTADVFILPTHYEGYGMVFAEAMLAGIPIIAGASGPVPSIIGDGGILVKPGDVQALTSAITRMLDDAPFRAACAKAAQERARTLPTWQHTTELFADALIRAKERPRPPR